MDFASQLIQNVKHRFQSGSSCESLENLTEEQLKCRKQKIKSVYSVLGLSFLIALIANSVSVFTESTIMDDQLLFLLPFAAGVSVFLVYLYKEYRNKTERINELLDE